VGGKKKKGKRVPIGSGLCGKGGLLVSKRRAQNAIIAAEKAKGPKRKGKTKTAALRDAEGSGLNDNGTGSRKANNLPSS